MKITQQSLVLLFGLLLFTCDNESQDVLQHESIIFQNDVFVIKRLNDESFYTKDLFDSFDLIINNRNNDYSSHIVESFVDNSIFQTDVIDSNSTIITQEVVETILPREGFLQNSVLVKTIDNNLNQFKFYIHRISSRDTIQIEEIVNPFTGQIISYELTGVSEEDYFNVYVQAYSRTICYQSFRACYNSLRASIEEDPEDSAICNILFCDVINYAACVILKGSGYTQDSDAYIGDANCDVIYNGAGQNIKGQ